MDIIILLLSGALFGILSISSGTGGGAFYVSFMTLFLLLPINISIDTSNFIILLPSASGFLIYLKGQRTNLKLTLIFSGFSIIGSLLSKLMLLFIKLENILLKFLFATLLIIIGLNMIYKSFRMKKDPNFNLDKIFNVENSFLKDFDYKKI